MKKASTNAQYTIQRRLLENCHSIYREAMRNGWRSSYINERFRNLLREELYARISQQRQSYIRGAVEAFRRVISVDSLTHVYLCRDGKFRAYNLDGYETYALPCNDKPESIAIDSECLLVYRDKPDHVYYASDELLASLGDKVTLNDRCAVLSEVVKS